jgi:Kef-type K+ transport system membrane component KefB
LPTGRRAVVYAIVIAASIAAIAALIRLGEAWVPSTGSAIQQTRIAERGGGSLAVLITQLLVVVLATQLVGLLATLLKQPFVIGEIAAGLLLGPSLLGQVWPDAYLHIFPLASLETLRLLSQVGVILFMFIVGLDLDLQRLRHQAPTAVAVSHFSIVVPFLLGVLTAMVLYAQHAPPGVPFHAFALFMGIALSITAFPVLARVIEERGLTRTQLGTTAIACAAVDDVTAWSILAGVVTLVTAGGVGNTLFVMVGAIGLFLGVMVWLVRPLLNRWFGAASEPLSRGGVAIVLLVLLASALATETIGIHALFGAFVAGVIVPQSPALRRQLRERLESLSSVFLLPLFFAFTGLRTQIALLDDLASWMVCIGIVLTAIAGKLVGSLLAARWTGASWYDAFVLGTLMNTRGLMELIALNVGYDLGILSPRMFTMLVVMALVTTAMTGPLLDLAGRVSGRRTQPA